MKKIIVFFMFLSVLETLHAQQNNITAAQAKDYTGKTVWVCDVIKEARLDNISKDEPTVLYTGDNYENRTLALIFKRSVLQTFPYEPAAKLINHNFCAHGKIIIYNGKPGIYIKSTAQLNIPQ